MTNNQSITHISLAGDRWDLLAWRYYGDASLYSQIIQANPAVQIDAVLSAGTTVAIPLLAKPAVAAHSLPPWKR